MSIHIRWRARKTGARKSGWRCMLSSVFLPKWPTVSDGSLVFAVGFIWLLYHHVLSHSITYISIHIKQSKLHDVAASPSWFSAASSHPYLSEVASQLIIRFCIQSNSGSINMRWKGMFFHLWRWVSWWSWRAISCNRNQPWLKRLTNGDRIYGGKFTIKTCNLANTEVGHLD